MRTALCAALAAATLVAVSPATAQQGGDFTIGVGVGYVMPKDGNGSLASGAFDIDVGDNARPTLTFEYFVLDNLGVEVLAAWPFTHSIDANGTEIGETTHLPPTLSLIYHIPTGSAVTPFLGAGVNFTWFYDTDLNATGRAALGNVGTGALKLDNSWGLAAVAGLDYALSPSGAIRAELRYLDIDTDASVNGTKVGTVEVDPLVFNLAYVFKF